MKKKSTLAQKLSSYSALTAAVLVGANDAGAQILYTDLTPDDTTVLIGSTFLDLNNDGFNDYKFNVKQNLAGSANQIRVVGAGGNKVLRDLINFPYSFEMYQYAAVLYSGDPISSLASFTPREILGTYYTANIFGNWIGTTEMFLGLELIYNSITYYGWARLSTKPQCDTLIIHDYAWDTVANEPIKAGDKCGNYASLVTTVVNAPIPSSFCDGSSAELSTDSLSGYLYQWYLDGVAIGGATDFKLTATAGGDYYVTVSTSYGCTDTSGTVQLTVFPLPATPSISQTGNTLTSSAAVLYQWYLNGSEIPGATSQSFDPVQGGEYTVMITDANGCTALSDPFTFIPIGIQDTDIHGVTLFENNNMLTVHLHDKKLSGGTLTVINTQGTQIYSSLMVSEDFQIDLSPLAGGTYLIRITNRDQTLVRKIVLK